MLETAIATAIIQLTIRCAYKTFPIFRSAPIQGVRLFKGCAYSRGARIQGVRLFKGCAYSRERAHHKFDRQESSSKLYRNIEYIREQLEKQC